LAGATGTVAGVALSQLFVKPPQTVTLTLDEEFKQKLLDTIAKAVADAVAKAVGIIGRTRIAMNIKEIIQSLDEEKLIFTGGFVRSFKLQPGQTVVHTEVIPPGYVFVIGMNKIEAYPDGAVAMYLYIDSDEPRFFDTAVVQSRYATPINYFDLGMFLKAEHFFRLILVNTSASEATFSFMAIYGMCTLDVWRAILNKYFKVIREEFGL